MMDTLLEKNRSFYESLWRRARLVNPDRFNTWSLIQKVAEDAPMRLEVGPGMRPRLPIAGTHFVDISRAALGELERAGGAVHEAGIHQLPFPDDHFDLVSALDIVEHVDADGDAVQELCRVAKAGAILLLSMPLYMDCWTPFDELVGHRRRYEIDELKDLLDRHQLVVEQSCVYGMQPKSSRVVDWAMNYLKKNPERAFWYYNKIFMPIGLRLQKPLRWEKGWCDLKGADEIFLVCRLQG